MKKYIFGYGSLINLNSLSKTMRRTMRISDVIPVKLFNYTRVWNLKENVFSEELNKAIKAIFLNLEYSENNFVNGVAFEISNSELKYLSERERNYMCLNITDRITPYPNFNFSQAEVFSFISTDSEFITNLYDQNCFVMKKYIQLVEQGCSEIGTYFLKDYQDTTSLNPFNTLEGDYKFF